ncbi:hypothetical protein DFH05DRAFT_1402718 [Lentinula detonsa]|uniref:SWIM-type domain-containing protein n=1 Tax=Lentinula detonsa TaxID=2804962 RepID=A0A9W8NVN1_9AGAR|nr:hypothetical protein DFH05DRAFT_1402718 [Lentinula detonsa]
MQKTGRFHDLPSWRKAFKKEWRRCEKADIPDPINPKYNPNPTQWVCTCPSFVRSRFLVCKHLVQRCEHVPAVFFREVQRSRTFPIWIHTLLKIRRSEEDIISELTNGLSLEDDEFSDSPPDNDSSDDECKHKALVLHGFNADNSTFRERMVMLTQNMHAFANGLNYNMQFRDERMLNSLYRYGGRFIRLMENCLEKERRQNSNVGAAPGMWDAGMASAMYYHSRPRRGEEGT